MSAQLEEAIASAQSPDKQTREQGEACIWKLCSEDPSFSCACLVQLACRQDYRIENRLFSLLSLRKLITMYWSAGFESYRGPPGVNEDCKELIRNSLLELGLDDAQDTRIQKGSSYCIVQIAAVDFPDEWPGLIEIVYNAILRSHSVSALYVLNEIFDDVVSEEMFFNQGVGWQTIQLISNILNDPGCSILAKHSAAKLYQACLLQLQSPAASSTPELRSALTNHIQESTKMLLNLLQAYSNIQDEAIDLLRLHQTVLKCLTTIRTGFPKKLSSDTIGRELTTVLIENFTRVAALSNDNTEEEKSSEINEVGIQMVSLLATIPDRYLGGPALSKVVEDFVLASCLGTEEEEAWESDFNHFVSKEVGLASSYYIRDECSQFLQEISGARYQSIFEILVSALSKVDPLEWRLKEAVFYLIQSLCINEDEVTVFNNNEVFDLLNELRQNMEGQNLQLHVRTRAILALPKVVEKFMDRLENVKDIVKELLFATLNGACEDNDPTLKASALIAFSSYASFAELDSVLGLEAFQEARCLVLNLIQDVLEDSEDDTPAVLLEALNPALAKQSNTTKDTLFYQQALNLVLKISAKDPSNLQVVLEAQDCISALLSGESTESYVELSKSCIPLFVNILGTMKANNYIYAPIVSLSLELLTVFMKKKPSDGFLPSNISSYVFEPLSDILINSSDDEILQVASDALTYLMSNSQASDLEPLLPTVLSILEKLLSVNTSDSGAMNVGSLVVITLEKYSYQLQEVYPKILEAATKRFVSAKNVATTENLVFVFCYLTSINPAEAINFLSSFTINEKEGNSLNYVLPKWLESFEVLRGERRIKENIVALSKIFFQSDPRVGSVIVNGDPLPYKGDIIVTRSMAKKMPIEYTRITAHEKIVKLFVAELEFQSSQPSLDKFLPVNARKFDTSSSFNNNAEDEQDDGEWEDVDDVLEYDQLQQFVVEDGERNDSDDEDSLANIQDIQQSTKELLIDFFKEAAAKNINNLRDLYENLSEHEKKILSENLM